MIKRIFDFTLALLGIIVLSPVLLLIALSIKATSKGPILFIQKRVGQFGKDLSVFKFRTMIVDAELKGLKITVGKDPRITSVGYKLRKYKLDELPQLFNVLFGTMSLVGPRPEVREYIDLYPEDIKVKVLSIKPGITDLASIEFKDENEMLSLSDNPHSTYINEILPIKQKYYIKYVDDKSIFLDIKIIFLTLKAIIN
jgi:lipopolysaccharide/colanic/teichoic acid biosynthesis glycosyltransferase